MGHEERLVELGALLRDRREELNWRRSDVARRVGVTHAYIARIEDAPPRPSGHRTRPSEGVLRRWMSALGVSGGDRARVLELAGYGAPSQSSGANLAGELGTNDASRRVQEHPLVDQLRAILDEADEMGETALVEDVLRPVLALLQTHLAQAQD